MRFPAIQEPSGTWAVVEVLIDLPAEIAGKDLIGLTREEAKRLVSPGNQEVTSAAGSARVVR